MVEKVLYSGRKTNCGALALSNSYSHRRSRTLWNNDQDLSWMHIVRFFEDHCEGPDTMVNKLTRQHIDLTSFSTMNVNLAAQVMSDSVAKGLRFAYKEQYRETSKLLEVMNKWFDCMNTRHLRQGDRERNANLNPYRDINDARLIWLETAFLQYFEDWKQCVLRRRGDFNKKARNKMQLAKPTIKGLYITTKSVVACIKFLLEKGATFVLTSHFNQDCLEQHFGHYRARGGANSNPSVYEAVHTLNQVRSVNSQALAPTRGNVLRQLDNVNINDTTRIPRKKQKRH